MDDSSSEVFSLVSGLLTSAVVSQGENMVLYKYEPDGFFIFFFNFIEFQLSPN